MGQSTKDVLWFLTAVILSCGIASTYWIAYRRGWVAGRKQLRSEMSEPTATQCSTNVRVVSK